MLYPSAHGGEPSCTSFVSLSFEYFSQVHESADCHESSDAAVLFNSPDSESSSNFDSASVLLLRFSWEANMNVSYSLTAWVLEANLGAIPNVSRRSATMSDARVAQVASPYIPKNGGRDRFKSTTNLLFMGRTSLTIDFPTCALSASTAKASNVSRSIRFFWISFSSNELRLCGREAGG